MSELGATRDPRALVPGVPEVIEADATALAAHGRRAEQVGQGLRRVDVGGWAGAAGARFANSWAGEPGRWLTVADTIGATSAALTRYAAALRWAQDQAGTAIQMWSQAEEQTTRAFNRYQVALADATARDEPIDPFVDLGERYRKQARELLDRAREQLREAGDQAAHAIRGLPVGVPGAGLRAGGTLNALVDAVTDGWTATGQVTKNGPRAGVSAAGPGSGKLAELKAFAQAGGATWTGAVRNGALSASGKAGFEIAAQAGVAASLGRGGLVAKAEGLLGARAEVEGHLHDGRFGVYARATGTAGLEGVAAAQVGRDGVGLTVGGTAGLRGGVAGGAELGGLSVGATAEGWVGAGAGLGLGIEKAADGRYHLGASAGAALGLGGKLGFEVTVDPNEVEQTAREAADAVGRGAENVGQTVGRGVENVGQAVGRGVESAQHTVGASAEHLGHALHGAAEDVGHALRGAAEDVGHAVGDITRQLNPR